MYKKSPAKINQPQKLHYHRKIHRFVVTKIFSYIVRFSELYKYENRTYFVKSKFSSLLTLKIREMRIFTLVFGYLEACQEDSDYNACAEFMQEDLTKCLIDCGTGF